ncbi:MAG: hypothetical protein WC831_02990 [Parcubacteria group bacterium]
MNNIESEKSWGEIGRGIISSLINLAEGYADNFIRRQREKMIRKIFSFLLFFSAALFILNGIAILINEILCLRQWAGYVLIGLGLLVVGLLIPKSDNYG